MRPGAVPEFVPDPALHPGCRGRGGLLGGSPVDISRVRSTLRRVVTKP